MKIRMLLKQDSTVVYFSDIPGDDARATIKREGFHWDPRGKYWHSAKDNAADVIRETFPRAEFEVSDISTPENEQAQAAAELLDALQSARAVAEKFYSVSKKLSNNALYLACYLEDNHILTRASDYSDLIKHLDDNIKQVQTLAVPGEVTKDNLNTYKREIKSTLAIKMIYKLDANEAPVIRVVDFGPGAHSIVNRCRNSHAQLYSIPEYKTIPDNPRFWVDVFRELCKSVELKPHKTTATRDDGVVIETWDTGKTLTWQEFADAWKYSYLTARNDSCISRARDAWRVLCELCSLYVY